MYVDLKLFRLEHGNMYQSEMGEILGVGQSVVSRMEKQFTELNEAQYKKLCAKYGEEDVQKYVKDSPLRNVVASRIPGRARRKNRENTDKLISYHTHEVSQGQPSDFAGLIAVAKSQQDEIVRLNQRIADLTEIILEKVFG